jgi:hypothetical protein
MHLRRRDGRRPGNSRMKKVAGLVSPDHLDALETDRHKPGRFSGLRARFWPRFCGVRNSFRARRRIASQQSPANRRRSFLTLGKRAEKTRLRPYSASNLFLGAFLRTTCLGDTSRTRHRRPWSKSRRGSHSLIAGESSQLQFGSSPRGVVVKFYDGLHFWMNN